MRYTKFLFLSLTLMFFSQLSFAQFDKSTCQKILTNYSKSNTDFKALNIATLDVSTYKQKFDIAWLKGFQFIFMEKTLDVKYTSATGTFHTYIPYSEIKKINTSKSALDIIIKN